MNPYLEYCSLHYLNQWLSTEKTLHLALQGNNRAEKLKALRKASVFFGVARNLPTRYEDERQAERLEPVLTILEKPEYNVVTEETLVQVVYAVRNEISRQYGNREVLSLTTKFLWLKHCDPLIIYDSNVRAALEVKEPDYKSFVAEWCLQYRKMQSAIKEACLKLPEMRRYVACGDAVSEQDIIELSKQSWFHRRVFDIFQWYRGKEET
jgi:hypothetical protein